MEFDRSCDGLSEGLGGRWKGFRGLGGLGRLQVKPKYFRYKNFGVGWEDLVGD